MPLTERLTFVIHRISARLALIGAHHFEELGLNPYSARILVMVRELGEVRAGALSELMVQPQSTISTQLQTLQKRKLIRRRRSPQDNRAVIVTLTEEGKRVADDCDELSARVQSELVNGMSADEVQAGYSFLNKFDHILNDLETREIFPFGKPSRKAVA
ncbi:MarR family winged helix-turn-helix transcriptional regulator [Noviherbaspirillum sp.]|uniref:MarR family winged helix-turn-helix transcriptional regulator n=1 Tax=Noviherbaspirillum sp. TaxID=1926288 RepID=UPI002B49F40A|nr:MarR family transcriptional regulator [Noviherbaspirillum sp.]HJV79995.1 MarR family transcriptional regulator [Noviherbaspirillum sp.]